MNGKHSRWLASVGTVTLVICLSSVGALAPARSAAAQLPTAVDLNPDPDIFETTLVAMEA